MTNAFGAVTALLLHDDLAIGIGQVSPQAPAPGEVVIATEFAGLCGSDVHAMQSGAWISYWPAVLGHEVAGVVVEGESTDASGLAIAPGARVVVDSRIPCRNCSDCERSPRLCGTLSWLGESRPGGFASQLVVPSSSVYRVPDGLAPDVAVLAEPLAVAMNALDLLARAPESSLILGYGPVGALLHLELARRWPTARIAVSEPLPSRRELALRGGARLLDDVAGSDHDLVIDAAAFAGSVEHAVRAARRGGVVLLVGIGGAPIQLSSQDIVERGVTLIGSIGFDDAHMPAALLALAADPGRYESLVSHRIPLSAFDRFLRDDGHRGANKVLVDCRA